MNPSDPKEPGEGTNAEGRKYIIVTTLSLVQEMNIRITLPSKQSYILLSALKSLGLEGCKPV